MKKEIQIEGGSVELSANACVCDCVYVYLSVYTVFICVRVYVPWVSLL